MADLVWNVALPPNLIFKGGYTISVQAIDPSTGNFVSGLQVQDFALEVATENPDELAYGPFVLVTGPQVSV